MSYDLELKPKVFDAPAIRCWFAERRHYAVSATQAAYSSPDTGVYFAFELFEGGSEVPEEREGPAEPFVRFSINFFRPHVFALEAEPEVAAFMTVFDCVLCDPQTKGMDGPAYSRERFITEWMHGNLFAYQVMKEQTGGDALVADPAEIEAVWRWNYSRSQLQLEAGDHLFVPKVVWLTTGSDTTPMRAVTWTFGVATMIPENLITHIVLVRQQRPSLLKLFSRGSGEAKHEFRLISTEGGIRLRGVERGEVDGQPALFTPVTGPLEVQALFSGSWPQPDFKLHPTDAILGAGLLDVALES